jgi:hypothetical protein
LIGDASGVALPGVGESGMGGQDGRGLKALGAAASSDSAMRPPSE